MFFVGLIAFVVVFILPLLTWFRTQQLHQQLADLQRRLAMLERALGGGPGSTAAPADPLPKAVRSGAEPEQAPADLRPSIPDRRHAQAVAGAADDDAETLEARIGGGLLLYAGMLVLVLGLGFFLRYAFENAWMSPAVRVALGMAVGGALGAAGLRLAAAYRAYGLFMFGGGIAVLYLSVYAALTLYALVSAPLAFVLLVAITVGGAFVADRTRSQALALMAVCGGFLVPFLVGGEEDAQVTLFTYDALLVGATTFLARRHDWPWLNVASLAFTAVTVAAWADAFYTPDKYLRTEVFLTLYCAMFVVIMLRQHRSRAADRQARVVTGTLALAPAAYHVASVVLLMPHGLALPIYLIAVTVIAVIGALQLELPVLRLAAWIAVVLPLSSWLEAHRARSWAVAAVTTVVAIFAVHLVAQLREARSRTLAGADIALVHANGVGLYAGLYEALVRVAGPPQLALLAAMTSLANAVLWFVVRASNADAALHWGGVAFTLAAIAVAIEFDGPWVVVMWAVEGAAVAWVAVRSGRPWLRAGAAALFALAIWRWAQADVQQEHVGEVALLNARATSGLLIVGLLYVVAAIRRLDPRAAMIGAGERAAMLVVASALTVVVTSREIAAYWALRTSAGADAYLARELMLSAAWAAYAAVLVAIGIRRRYAPIRYFAIALFALTLAKVFLVDFETLGGIYRVAGFIVVGLILLGVSFLYQTRGRR